jgi:hypothetical protein
VDPPDPPDPPPEEKKSSGDRRQRDRRQSDRQRQGWVPRPPANGSSADFIVVVFAITVATILLVLTVGVVIAGIFGADIKSYFAILTSIITSMISALVGYLAGKGQGRQDAEQEHEL